jgi:hypothetical protein
MFMSADSLSSTCIYHSLSYSGWCGIDINSHMYLSSAPTRVE